ncbi:MAG: C1 family peptidase [Cyanobacteria bacterium CAN_BIN43]|nr:C1 family peptidase [Cyanobacteria bacterium CAN_BIN43]
MTKHYRQVRLSTIVENKEGKVIKIGGYQADRRKSKVEVFSSKRSKSLPEQVDLRPYMSAVEDQRDTNSCAANAIAGAYEYLMKRLKGRANDVSRLFIYYNARDLDGDTTLDQGTYISSCVKATKKQGLCAETTWPFNPAQILDRPAEIAYEEAQGFLLKPIPRRVEVNLQAMKNCLAEGFPFIFGLQLFGSFQKAGSEGLVPMPDVENEQHDGGHAMLCVGYSEPDNVFIVRNSWGKEWGEYGYCYIPYDYMTDPELNTDCWTLIRKADVTPSHKKKKDLSQGIKGKGGSLFRGQKAQVARAIQTPGAYHEVMVGEEYELYEMVYVEQLVYTAESGFIPVEEYDDLEFLYSEENSEEYLEEHEEDEEDNEEDDYEEEDSEDVEDSYEDEGSEDVDEDDLEESGEEESEDTEDSYDEEESEAIDEEDLEESDEEESEDTEDSYDEEESEAIDEEDLEKSDDEESEDTEDSYDEEESEAIDEEDLEESDEEESEDSYENAEDSYEESTDSYEDEGYDDGGDSGSDEE